MYISACHMCLVPTECVKSLWNWSYRWLLVAVWIPENELGST